MIMWHEKDINPRQHPQNVHNKTFRTLTMKSGQATVATVDIRVDGIKWVRIRSVWNTKQDFSTHGDMESNSYSTVDSVDKIQEYCQMRWSYWLEKAGLVEKDQYVDLYTDY